MSEVKSYFVFRFKKEEGLPWVVYRKGKFLNKKLTYLGKLDTPAMGWSRDHKGTVVSELALYHDKAGIITVDVLVENDDIDLAETLWKEGVGNMLDKRNASCKAAQKAWERTFKAFDSTDQYTRP